MPSTFTTRPTPPTFRAPIAPRWRRFSLTTVIARKQVKTPIISLVSKLKEALRRSPEDGWREVSINLAWLAPSLLLIGFAGELMRWAPQFDISMLKLGLIAVVVPALGEELLFRAAILPKPEEGAPLPIKWMVLSTILFVLWHPLQAPIYGGKFGSTMLDPWFLTAVALTGWACARLYWKTRSIWPSVALHWIVIMAWKALLDGPSPWTG